MYLPRQGGGWLYLAGWRDRCSRKIVGGDGRDTMPEDLVSEALPCALVARRPPAGLVVHSDQGSQYTATRFQDLVAKHGARQSRSRRGNCYDNARAESLWSRFKAELLDEGSFPGLAPVWPKPGSKSAPTSPITTPSGGILRSATRPPITSKPIFKQRPNAVRLS